ETGPVKVILEEPVSDQPAGKYERTPDPRETGLAYYNMAKAAHGPRARVTFIFADGTPMKCHLDGDFGPGLGGIFKFDAGYLDLNRDKIDSDIPEVLENPDKPAPLSVPETRPHIENWVACIKNRQKCTADIEYGLRATTLCELVNIVRRVGRVNEELEWDPVAERFKNCDEGNAMLSRPRRAGYELPEA
ncbi:MAG TPA: gfo/Idh/MocA family oxidoreductase, partial [Candidatus Hydrogenedentes bacterium]|nr:gfo/Idh/MocA family oxidoreductase [Candidatus Hydrogenedentota bacterium]